MKDKLIKKFVDRMMAFVNTKGVTAIKDGIVFSMPLLIVGSIFLILANFPVPALATMLETSGITLFSIKQLVRPLISVRL